MTHPQPERRVITSAKRDIRIAVYLDSAWAARQVQVLALQAITLRLNVHVAVQLQRTKLTVDLDLISREFDAVFMSRMRRCVCRADLRHDGRSAEKPTQREDRAATKHGKAMGCAARSRRSPSARRDA